MPSNATMQINFAHSVHTTPALKVRGPDKVVSKHSHWILELTIPLFLLYSFLYFVCTLVFLNCYLVRDRCQKRGRHPGHSNCAPRDKQCIFVITSPHTALQLQIARANCWQLLITLPIPQKFEN